MYGMTQLNLSLPCHHIVTLLHSPFQRRYFCFCCGSINKFMKKKKKHYLMTSFRIPMLWMDIQYFIISMTRFTTAIISWLERALESWYITQIRMYVLKLEESRLWSSSSSLFTFSKMFNPKSCRLYMKICLCLI